MKIIDIYSWLPEEKIGIEEIKSIFINSCDGINESTYEVNYELPDNADKNIIECKNSLIKEGKKIAYIKQIDKIIAIVSYNNK